MHDFSSFLALLTPTSALFPSHRGLPLTPEGKVSVKLTLPGTCYLQHADGSFFAKLFPCFIRLQDFSSVVLV